MERHVAKRLGLPCAVISGPAHVQDYPARHSPLMGFEGANVLFDTLVHPLMMGLEEHLLGLFREDREFHAEAAPSHLGGHGAAPRDEARAPLPPPTDLGPVRDRSASAQVGQARLGLGEGGPRVSEGRERDATVPNGAPVLTRGQALPDAGLPSPASLRSAPSPAEGGGNAAPWAPEAERELKKIPFFVRGRARTNTETFARERRIPLITLETLYDAKAHFGR